MNLNFRQMLPEDAAAVARGALPLPELLEVHA